MSIPYLSVYPNITFRTKGSCNTTHAYIALCVKNMGGGTNLSWRGWRLGNIWGATIGLHWRRKFWVFTPLDSWKMHSDGKIYEQSLNKCWKNSYLAKSWGGAQPPQLPPLRHPWKTMNKYEYYIYQSYWGICGVWRISDSFLYSLENSYSDCNWLSISKFDKAMIKLQ